MVIVRYWRGADSRPRSIDEKPKHITSQMETNEVSENEIIKKKDRYYYDLQCGQGENIRLLVNYPFEKTEPISNGYKVIWHTSQTYSDWGHTYDEYVDYKGVIIKSKKKDCSWWYLIELENEERHWAIETDLKKA